MQLAHSLLGTVQLKMALCFILVHRRASREGPRRYIDNDVAIALDVRATLLRLPSITKPCPNLFAPSIGRRPKRR